MCKKKHSNVENKNKYYTCEISRYSLLYTYY